HVPTLELHSFPTRRSSDLRAVRHDDLSRDHPVQVEVLAPISEEDRDPVDRIVRRDDIRVEDGRTPVEHPFGRSSRSGERGKRETDRKSTRLNSSHLVISYA